MNAESHKKSGDNARRATAIVRLLKRHYPDARCTLNFGTVHELMVATILSAQCTDERVNMETPTLFRKYRSVSDFAGANLEELARDIRATGFHNAKAKAIKTSAQQLVDSFGGQVPKEIAKLVTLQGVGRKTASVILGAGFGIAEGIAVDTHVGRLSRLLGFTRHQDPIKVEKDLQELVPRKDWIVFSHLLIRHGRTICPARRPDCKNCFLNRLCPSAKL